MWWMGGDEYAQVETFSTLWKVIYFIEDRHRIGSDKIEFHKKGVDNKYGDGQRLSPLKSLDKQFFQRGPHLFLSYGDAEVSSSAGVKFVLI